MRKDYESLYIYKKMLKDKLSKSEIDDMEVIKALKRIIRSRHKLDKVVPPIKTLYPFANDETFVKVFTIRRDSFYSKEEMLDYLWQHATKITSNYSPTGQTYTVAYKVGYQGIIDGLHWWRVHEIMSIDV